MYTKKFKEIALKLKDCLKRFGIPEQVESNNGAKFINKDVNSLMEKYYIKYIHGKPYNPHSLGIVERVHRNVRNGLICKYLENQNSFNLKLSLDNVVNVLNNNIHLTNKYKLFDIFT